MKRTLLFVTILCVASSESLFAANKGKVAAAKAAHNAQFARASAVSFQRAKPFVAPRTAATFNAGRYSPKYSTQARMATVNPRVLSSYNNTRAISAYNNSRALAAYNNSRSISAYNNSRAISAYNNKRALSAYNQSRVLSAYNSRAIPAYNNRANWNRNSFVSVPYAVHRNWDRRSHHEWNHCRYRWAGNSWVVINSYPSYGYGYSYPSTYSNYDYVESYPTTQVQTYTTAPADSGDLGMEVQEALAGQGYYQGEVDGDVGPMTRDAIAAYERDHNLPVTGNITRALLDSLGLE